MSQEMTRVAAGRARACRFLDRLSSDRRGLALLEFALAFPVLLAIGGWGIEVSYLAFMNMKISQLSLNLADSVSRVGADAGAGVSQLRDADINDVFTGVRLTGKAIGLGDNGRVTLSSLELKKQSYDTTGNGKQRIHWQRCFGKKNGAGYDSSYGVTSTAAGSNDSQANAGLEVTDGMGDTNFKVKAPQDNAVMFVEINYLYKPIFGSLFVKPQIIHHTASLIVRDNRDLRQVYSTPGFTASTCNLYTA
jgi:Flp pilus assembly protein TadG